ncbi:MAG: tetratricopeptide repeat protein [Candidatus Sulfotelmatobacter sp.]
MPQPKAQTPISSLTRPELLSLAGVLIGTLLTFASTFTFGWVYDDPPQIPQNPNLEWSRFGFLVTHQLWASVAGMEGRFYRPLLTLWFLINKTLFGLNPHYFHVTTVLAHVAATALAFFVARALLKDAGAALFAAAIFAVHPLQVESASWISSVNDPLAGALCFASLLIYRKARTAPRNPAAWWTLAGILFLLALLTKEVSIVLPGIILVDFIFVDPILVAPVPVNRSSNSRTEAQPASPQRFTNPITIAAIATYGAAAVLWLTLRSWALGGTAAISSSLPWSTTLLSAPKVILFNLYRVVLPIGLSPHYDFRLIESPGPQFLLTLLVLLALAALASLAAKRHRELWVAFAWLIFPMLPTLNLRWMNEDDFIHDRYLYMTMLGVALLAASAYARIRDWIKIKWPAMQLFRPLAACVIVMLAFASAIQSEYWATDVTLFARAVDRAPGNEWAQLNYGSALSARGKFADAAPHFARSYELKPGWRAADFAGFAYQQSGDLSQAESWFRTALQLDPSLANAWFGLGQVSLLQHLPEQAITYLRKALQLEPTADGYHYALGTALEQISQRDAAIEEYKTELQMHPYQTGARKALERLQFPAR